MRNYEIDVFNQPKSIYPALQQFHAKNAHGDEISLTNYYLEYNGQPFFAISGEFHYSRYHHEDWEDEIIKMKMSGINIVSTYIFWIHHEEIEGEFDWTGNKNVRKFIELCERHGMFVIIRIGPFNHGEVRNGGIPDWLYGRPFTLRSNDEAYLQYVARLYREVGKQVKGLLFKDNGPIIGTQLENEYGHAGAPWELTTGTSHEWVPAGYDGEQHLKCLKELALEAGIVTPIYTATAWGGAIAPTDEVLPLWGGYAYWPWIFYGDVEEHPATPNYVFRDYHNSNVAETFDFEPAYDPETIPYACAEMGGGMTVFYPYRFKLPYESVDALSAIKVAGGCNFVGYYVYHGGSNPKGKRTPFLNETTTPKISYDYQAPIGEFGQVRASYHRLKRQHLFYQQYKDVFIHTKTYLAADPDRIEPEDVDTLRYAVRSDGEKGFLFINNFQDHVEMKDQKDFTIAVKLDEETIKIPSNGGLSLAKDTNCILPFNFALKDVCLKYATAQLITELTYDNETYYFFFTPKGMSSEYVFRANEVNDVSVDHGSISHEANNITVQVDKRTSLIRLISHNNDVINICTLTDEASLDFWKVSWQGQEYVLLTGANVLVDEERLRLEYTDDHAERIALLAFPSLGSSIKAGDQEIVGVADDETGIFTKYGIQPSRPKLGLDVEQVSDHQAILDVDPQWLACAKEIIVNIDYVGDIGYAFIDGELIHDNFSNGGPWEIGLKRWQKQLQEKELYLSISPIKEGVQVKSDTPMAGRTEIADKEIAVIESITATAVYDVEILCV